MGRQKKIVLLDANAIVHRAYHAIPELTAPNGQPINAVYGFAHTLLKVIEDESPDAIVACYDTAAKTFRHQLFDGYKAGRKKSDQALYDQIPLTKKLLDDFNLLVYEKEGLEADDLIASITDLAVKQDYRVVIATGDNDALQLVGPSVTVYSLHRGKDVIRYDTDGVIAKLGVKPEQVVEYKALAGDASDNIPGAPGVGPKTAADLLSRYNDLATISQHLDELSPRLRDILKTNRHQVELSKDLATMRSDLKINLSLSQAERRHNYDGLRRHFQALGFFSLMKKIPESSKSAVVALATTDFELVTDLEKLRQLARRLSRENEIVIDTETEGLDGELLMISLSFGVETAVLPISPPLAVGLPLSTIKDRLGPILADNERRLIGHNLKYDLSVLEKNGFKLSNRLFCTFIASQLVNAEIYSHSLDDLVPIMLKKTKISLASLIGPKKDGRLAEAPLDKLSNYAAEDAHLTGELYKILSLEIEQRHLKQIFYEIEMPLVSVLNRMERRGVRLDLKYLALLSDELKNKLKETEAKIHDLAKTDFLISSPRQLSDILFNKLQLPTKGVRRGKSGDYSTDAEVMKSLSSSHPIIKEVIDYRELSKLLATYVLSLPDQADAENRVHTSFLQLGAATGRLSSVNPNLQNIPVRTELGLKVRRAFVAPPGSALVSADYSQVELRILAHLSGDPALITAFNDNQDFHQAVALKMGVDRRTAKAINFGVIYGLGPVGLSHDLEISVEAARRYIDEYFSKFSGVAEYVERCKVLARQHKYAETLFGRRRYLPNIESKNPVLRAAAERMAINMPPQGSVADITKKAMIRLDRELPPTARLLLQIHDELLFEVEKDALATVLPKIRQTMEEITSLKVPLKVDLALGDNWADLKEIER